MEENQRQDEELKDLRTEFHSVASTHVTISQFTWTLGILMTIVVVGFSYVMSSINSHDDSDDVKFAKIDEQHQTFMNQNTSFQVTYAKIEVQLAQIQTQILELKKTLTEHDIKR